MTVVEISKSRSETVERRGERSTRARFSKVFRELVFLLFELHAKMTIFSNHYVIQIFRIDCTYLTGDATACDRLGFSSI